MKTPRVSIILRSFNEERWIGSCLQAIFSQSLKDELEVILVDNNSTDKTLEKASQYPVKILNIDKFIPGKALNMGIQISSGEYFVCLSAHCIPTNSFWLENLLKNFENPQEDKPLAAVYGRQEPMSFTTDTDKRDLLTVFGLDRKVQYKDSFFHNANSLIPRKLWDEVPFSETAANIEDRIWAKEILSRGHCIVYEPEASVYHWHGIHQNQNQDRCRNVVRIIEGLNAEDGKSFQKPSKDNLNVFAIIPYKGELLKLDGKTLLERTIGHAKSCHLISKVFVSTDSEEVAEHAKACGAEVPFLRDPALAQDFVSLEDVYQNTLLRLEDEVGIPDVVVALEATFPFREASLIDKMIEELLGGGHDTVVCAKKEFSSVWKKESQGYVQLDTKGFAPRQFKDPFFITSKGVGVVTYPNFLRDGKLFGQKLGIVEIENSFSAIEVRDVKMLEFAGQFFKG
jgi:CMP-N-acetylneuraminic acid synthetase/GT2 family glycosyltransferase